jgi:hypothetical protein
VSGGEEALISSGESEMSLQRQKREEREVESEESKSYL